MTSQQIAEMRRLFDEALEVRPEQRGAWLAERASGEVLIEVERLLQGLAHATETLEKVEASLTATPTDAFAGRRAGAYELLEAQVASIEVKETDTEVRIEFAADVLFDFDKAVILPKAEQTLAQAADVIRQRGKREVRLEGHTDSKGGHAYNQKLSRQRADSVKAWLLKKQGLASLHYVVSGFGATRPVATNIMPDGSDDPVGRQQNRRVEIILSKK